MPRALLLENIHPLATDILTEAGYDVENRRGALDEEELIEALDGVSLLGIRSKTQVSSEVLARSELDAVGAFCIGTNQIDLAAAAERGVAAFNAPFSNTRSVVELVLAEIIALSRRLTVQNSSLHKGVWNKSADGAHEVRGRTLGIVGYGNIGTQLSVVAEALGMSVIFYDTAEKLALGNAKRVGSLDDLLGQADVVTLHVDGRPGNAGMFGAAQFAAMRPGALFLNLSRGFLVDYDALRERILDRSLSGAAVDVFPTEPKSKGDSFDSALRGLDNVILTPHVGGSTEEAQHDIGIFVANKLRDYQATGATNLSVNLPGLVLEAPRPGAHRVTLLHRNVPGVMAQLNEDLSRSGANVEYQVLGTRGQFGYAVTDVGGGLSADLLSELEALPTTIRARVIEIG
ncbi:D-3-phosphoglycerate dehydrogenase [Salana multivorans]|uniref:2-oxoglutarate reductase n=1 Tax=Salana multivorans TaxID=120377 RepID=A0A3N2D2H3_9MICO|nr:phosphoglycerate dehydrogenase [Salana multivorans]MBN8881722.1 phosphoglycerate dehydrogenase [Salana multivorans]OJX95619.1 MAG: D-3-phosphoglycerate dehydrogenase [Micrococcales bacterium 73-15]ROR93858.1 D-3-phosphoglycerate dehydrogenase [Salana multivorans]